jgi:hypothetical protein
MRAEHKQSQPGDQKRPGYFDPVLVSLHRRLDHTEQQLDIEGLCAYTLDGSGHIHRSVFQLSLKSRRIQELP